MNNDVISLIEQRISLFEEQVNFLEILSGIFGEFPELFSPDAPEAINRKDYFDKLN